MDIEKSMREKAEKELLMKLQEAEEAVEDGSGWLNLDEVIKATLELSLPDESYIMLEKIKLYDELLKRNNGIRKKINGKHN